MAVGYLVDSPGWRGVVRDFDWHGYYALGKPPVTGGKQSRTGKIMVEENRLRRERQAAELLRRRAEQREDV